MRWILFAGLLCLAACKSAEPPPPPGGVNVRAPFVNVGVGPNGNVDVRAAPGASDVSVVVPR